jgi:hypothetical protein
MTGELDLEEKLLGSFMNQFGELREFPVVKSEDFSRTEFHNKRKF